MSSPRRRPRFLPFILTGAILGFLVGAYLASRPDGTSGRVAGVYDPSAAVGYLGFLCAGIAAVLAALVALLLERLRDR